MSQQHEPIHRYEKVEVATNTNKFWEIEEPYERKAGGGWQINVHFGRRNTAGQTRVKVCWSHASAIAFYQAKLKEKLNKGYKYIGMTKPPQAEVKQPVALGKPHNKPILVLPPGTLKPIKKEEKECVHNNLRRVKEGLWKCPECKAEIDFEKPPKGKEAVAEVTQVKRYFDFSAFGK